MANKNKFLAIMLSVIIVVSGFNFVLPGTAEAYISPAEYYDVWDDFEEQIWPQTLAGAAISGNYNASMVLTHETETDGNKYMKAAGNNASAWRATMYKLSDDEISGAEVVFDLLPIKTNGDTRYGDIMFFSSSDNYSYFNITFNQALQIFYYNTPGVNYTADPYVGIDINGNALSDGSHAYRISQLQETGLQGDGSTWFTVKIVFDYTNSLADLTITNKSDPTKTFTQSGIPIREAAVNVNRFLLTAFKGQPEFGLDNFGVKYLTEIDPAQYYTTYWNDFEAGIWDNQAIGTGIIAEGGASAAALTSVTEAAYGTVNNYMRVDASSSGSYRVSRLNLPDEALSGADVTFDWKPISAQDSASRFGDIAFISSGSTYPYFGLQFDKNLEIAYYTIGENIASGWGVTYSNEALEGGFRRNVENNSGWAANTGITADGDTWYTVHISFDYDGHHANLAIAERDNPGKVLYEAEAIPIYASAANTAIVAAGGWKGIISMGLDNFGVRYKYSDAASIASVQQPANVMVVAREWEQHTASRPAKAVATMGDGSIQEFAIGQWTSSPEFKENEYTTYTWTAPLILPEGIRNPKNLTLSYQVEYVSGYYATGAYDPASLELEFGSVASVDELIGLLPKQTHAVLNNGKVVKLDIDSSSWTATYTTLQDLGSYKPAQLESPEFNPEQEGIYVYKAKLKSTGDYEVNSDIWVECRINYFSYENNFNGHERSIEYLDRGLYATKNTVFDSASNTYVDSTQGGIFLSWRILVDEYAKVSEGKDIVFDIYRNGIQIDTVGNITNYLDIDGAAGDKYFIKTTQDGVVSFSKEEEALEDNYISLKLQRPLPSYSQTGNFAVYRLNDLGVADVDGDGVYEIAVKWYPTNGFDPGTSAAGKMSSPHIIDIYKLDGTPLWRLNMGYSSPSGQHFDNFMFYDLDQDGKAEFSILTQDGTRTYRPDENGQFKYVTTDEGGYVFQADNPADSESSGKYMLSEDGKGYILSNAPGYDFAYVGDYGSPVMDDAYLIDVVGDIALEGVGMRNDGFKGLDVNEYFTVFNGETGEIIDTVDYLYNSKNVVGTEGFNIGNRYNIAIAYIPDDMENNVNSKAIPAVLANRGYYARATVAAYTLVDGKIKLAWDVDTVNEIKGGGNHNMVTGDMDNDGFDELYLGGTAIDHDGTILWAKDGEYNQDFMKHGDMIHMSAVFPDSDQLYVFTPVEDGSVSTILNYALSNAATGARIVGHTFGRRDTGRAMLANITPNAGYELWASTPSGIVDGRISDALFNVYGEVVTQDGNALSRPTVQTWSGYWDGDLLSELPDSNPAGGGDKSGLPMGVHKYNWETGKTEAIASFNGTLTNNSTKNNPGLIADILGDWREEILVRSADNEELRIYLTNIPTEYTIYTLMHDSVYRNAVANQNTSYNQPAHTSFYLGEDEVGRNRVLSFELPTYNYRYTTGTNEPAAPGQVSEVQVAEGNGRLVIRWQDPAETGSGLKHIHVAAYEGNTVTSSVYADPGVEQATFTGLTNGVSYEVRLTAVDTDGNISEAVIVNGTPRSSSGNAVIISPPATNDEDAEVEIGPDGEIIVHIEDSDEGNPALAVTLTEDIVAKALEGSPDGKLRIRSNGAAVTLNGKLIGELRLKGNLGVAIATENAADLPPLLLGQAQLNGADHVYTISLTSDDQLIHSVAKGSLTVSLRYEPEAPANLHQIVAYELLEDGSLVPVALSRYDSGTGQLLFQPGNLEARYLILELRTGFNDASGWSQAAVEALAARGIVNGKGNSLFDPQGTVTRAEFTAMLTRMFGLQSAGEEAPFGDVPADAWYRAEIAAAYASGIVDGRTDGSFGGNDPVSREEMSVLLHRTATLMEMLDASNARAATAFSDEAEIAAYAREAVGQLTEAGLINGLPGGIFAPRETATREQAATIIWRLLQQVNE